MDDVLTQYWEADREKRVVEGMPLHDSFFEADSRPGRKKERDYLSTSNRQLYPAVLAG